MRHRTASLVLLASVWGALFLTTPELAGASSPADTDALRQKTEEIERLKRELEWRERELRQLEQENERLRQRQAQEERQRQEQEQQKTQHELEGLRRENERLRQEQHRPERAASVPAPAVELRPTTAVQDAPPLTEGTVVPAEELVAHFVTEPEPARTRYADRTFRVRGEVDRFDRAMVTRAFSVMLRSPDRATSVKFAFNYVDQYRTVFTAQDGRLLVARDEKGRETTLFTVGEPVTFEGRCQGLKGGTIAFSRGRRVP